MAEYRPPEAEEFLAVAPVDWDLPYPFELWQLGSDQDWDALRDHYEAMVPGPEESGAGTRRPWRRCLEVARLHDAKTAVVETRYIDIDYRSEYSQFYSKAFRSFPDSSHRVHFFRKPITAEAVPNLPADAGYLGYICVRPPQTRALVGRTMLSPPPELQSFIRAQVKEVVHFFGQQIEVRAFPFAQQDARSGSCAHAAAWMAHLAHTLNGHSSVQRRAMGDFTTGVNPQLAPGRLTPSAGLSLEQLSGLLTTFGLAPLYYPIAQLQDTDRPSEWPVRPAAGISESDAAAKRMCCRYLNGQLPVIAVVRQAREGATRADRHAMVACGYRRTAGRDGDVQLIVNDDRRGPYLTVASVKDDTDAETGEHYMWDQALVPLPDKLWISGEAAERNGCSLLLGAATAAASSVDAIRKMVDLHSSGGLTIRTYATTSWRFKRRLRERTSDPVLLRELSLARMPRFLWVVEAIDRVRRDDARGGPSGSSRGAECVMAELVFDATSDERAPDAIAMRLPALLVMPKPGAENWNAVCSAIYLRTGGQYDP